MGAQSTALALYLENDKAHRNGWAKSPNPCGIYCHDGTLVYYQQECIMQLREWYAEK